MPLIALFELTGAEDVDVGAMLNSQPCFEGNREYEPEEWLKYGKGFRAK